MMDAKKIGIPAAVLVAAEPCALAAGTDVAYPRGRYRLACLGSIPGVCITARICNAGVGSGPYEKCCRYHDPDIHESEFVHAAVLDDRLQLPFRAGHYGDTGSPRPVCRRLYIGIWERV